MGFNGRCRPKNVKGHRWINYPNTAHKKCTKCSCYVDIVSTKEGWISSYEVIYNSIYAKINKVNKDGSLSKVLNKRINVEEYNFELIRED